MHDDLLQHSLIIVTTAHYKIIVTHIIESSSVQRTFSNSSFRSSHDDTFLIVVSKNQNTCNLSSCYKGR